MRKNGSMTNPADTEKAPTRARRYWGWLVVLGAIIVLIGGGIGALVLSNSVATSRYADITDEVATLSIPRFGHDYAVPIVEGTSLADLRRGVGWYDQTAQPGQIGNFALSGHRLGWGQPFADLGSLQVGDTIIVSVGTVTYTYHVITGPIHISEKQTSVLAPVPGDPSRTPTKALITLTTAASLLPSPDRLVVIGELVSAK